MGTQTVLCLCVLTISLDTSLDQLFESTVDRRPKILYTLVEVNCGNSTLADSFGGELEFLSPVLVS